MASMRNVVVAQSGGPSAVINSSLRGVVQACQEHPQSFGRIYGGRHGIEGVLREELWDLSCQNTEEIALLRTTPACGAIGTCRYKLRHETDFARVVDVLRAHEVGYFFYIGGNDSMDTAYRVAELAHSEGLDLVATGVPKTIDNDVGDPEFRLIDHTPGYGSIARYWALYVQNANQENAGASPSDPVLVLQTMGRRVGFIPAAARLGDPDRETPLLILLPEAGVQLAELADLINDSLRASGRAIVVVSEGFEVGELGERRDAFGHTMFSASQMTVAQVIVNHLNDVGLAASGSARANVPGTDQRDSIVYASTVDLDEAHDVGRHAVHVALSAGSGFMATILRAPGHIYRPVFDRVPLQAVANSERRFPAKWIAASRIDVSDEFLDYARPLIGNDWPTIPIVDGIQRFARLRPVFASKLLPPYTPWAYWDR
jgi:6-phosphofructokinase 1